MKHRCIAIIRLLKILNSLHTVSMLSSYVRLRRDFMRYISYIKQSRLHLAYTLHCVDPGVLLMFLINQYYYYKISSGDEIANVNFYAVRQKGTRIR